MDMNLPGMCFYFLESNAPGKQVVAIQRGECGFFLTTYDETDPEKAKVLVTHMNKKLGVTDAQAECMLVGSIFGWEVPGAQLGGKGVAVDALIGVPSNVLASLIDMANSHIQDIESGIEDGTYLASENKDIDSKQLAAETADELYRQGSIEVSGMSAANLFMQELLDSVETLTGIADEHGARTLADLMYLQNAIMKNGFVDHYPGESKVLEIASALPSGDRWAKFVKVEQLLDTADTNKSKLEIEPTKIIVVLEGGIVQSVLAAKSGVSVAVIDYDKNASWDDLIEIPQDGGKKATAFAAIHEPEVIDQARITELYTAVSRNVSISEMSASLTDAATIATQKESYTVADPSVDRHHEGKVLGVTDQHVVLSIGRAAVILAQEDIDKVPAIGDDVVVKFAGGKGSVELVKGKEVDQGR